MEKKVLTEINQIRKMMGLSLLIEAGPWADIIGRLAGGVVRNDVELAIGKSLKKIAVADIDRIMIDAASGSVLKKADLDILKALDSEIKKVGNKLGVTNANGLVGLYDEAAKAASKSAPGKARLFRTQGSKLKNTLTSSTPSTGSITNKSTKNAGKNAGVAGQAASAARSKLKGMLDGAASTGSKKINTTAVSDVINDIIDDQIANGYLKLGKVSKSEVVDTLVKNIDENWETMLPDIEKQFAKMTSTQQRQILQQIVAKADSTIPTTPKSKNLFLKITQGLNIFTNTAESLPKWKSLVGALGSVYATVAIISGVSYLTASDDPNLKDGMDNSIKWPRTFYQYIKGFISSSLGSTPAPTPGGSDDTKNDDTGGTETGNDTNTGGDTKNKSKEDKKSSGGGEEKSSGAYNPADDDSTM
jgi:hypothetical protein